MTADPGTDEPSDQRDASGGGEEQHVMLSERAEEDRGEIHHLPQIGSVTLPTSLNLKKSRLVRACITRGRIEPEVTIRLRGRDASARRTLEESVLDEKWLVNFFERTRILSDRGSDGADADGSAVELFDDCLEDAGVHVVEPQLIDFEEDQCIRGAFERDLSARPNLRELANEA